MFSPVCATQTPKTHWLQARLSRLVAAFRLCQTGRANRSLPMSDTPRNLVRRTPWPETSSRPVGTPIQPSVVYASECPDALDAQYEGRVPGYTYAREGHPNADVLAQKIDALEGAEGGLVVGSGMAAVTAVMMGLLRAGDHVAFAAASDPGPAALRDHRQPGRPD